CCVASTAVEPSVGAALQNRRLAALFARNRSPQPRRESEIAMRVSHQECSSHTSEAKAVAVELCATHSHGSKPGCGSRKTVPASDGSESKHEHASRRTALFP